jgi:hypothetical protein
VVNLKIQKITKYTDRGCWEQWNLNKGERWLRSKYFQSSSSLNITTIYNKSDHTL